MHDSVGLGSISAILGLLLLLNLDVTICHGTLLPGSVASLALGMDLGVCHDRLGALLHLSLRLDELLLVVLAVT